MPDKHERFVGLMEQRRRPVENRTLTITLGVIVLVSATGIMLAVSGALFALVFLVHE